VTPEKAIELLNDYLKCHSKNRCIYLHRVTEDELDAMKLALTALCGVTSTNIPGCKGCVYNPITHPKGGDLIGAQKIEINSQSRT
jgi:hypothetical protein